jgi:RNA polymerase sigma factor (sigma-70 family)
MRAPSNAADMDSDSVISAAANCLCAERVLAHQNWLMTVFSTRLGKYRHVAEDLFANLLAELVAGKHDLHQIEALEPWLYRLSVNKANDWLRNEQRYKSAREKLASIQGGTNKSIDQSLPLDVVLLGERSQLLQKALDSLDVEDAEILNLKYLHDWSYVQLEKHLGLSQSQITHHLRLARQRLKQILLQIQDASHWAN